MEEQIKVSDDINEVLQVLKKINIDISIPSNASRSDKGLHNLLIEGTEENNYKKIYRFVRSVEMGCGFYSSETAKLKKMYDIAISRNKDMVIEILNDKSKLIDIVYNCHCIQGEHKLLLLQSPYLTNAFVAFELIRQLLNDIKLQGADNYFKYKAAIGNGIIKLASLDTDLYQYFIKEFEHKEEFHHVMGVALSNMSAIDRKIFAKSITIDKQDNNYYNYVNTLLQNIGKDKYDSFIMDIKEVIYQRWNDYLSALLKSKEFVSSIIINSYGDIILNCLCKRYEDKELFFGDLDAIATEFSKAIYKWYEKETEFSSMYYIYATKLFFLKNAQEINNISLSDRKNILDKIQNLFDNNCMIHNKYTKVEDIIIGTDT